MKTTTITLLAAAAAFGFTACDQAKETAAEAAAKAKDAAAEAAAQTKEAAAQGRSRSAIPDLKAKAAGCPEKPPRPPGTTPSTKAEDTARYRRGLDDTKNSVCRRPMACWRFRFAHRGSQNRRQTGMTGEKATALKAKWDDLYAKSSETIKNLAPEQQEKLKAILATVKAKWDELMAKSEGGAVQ